MTLWDTVKGMMEGFEENGIIGGFYGAVEGLINSVIMAPLDLIKDLVSWVLEKLGFDGAAETLDSFSFVDIFSSVMETWVQFVFGIKNKFIDGINSVIEWANGYLPDSFAIDTLEPGTAYVAAPPKPKEVEKTTDLENETAVSTDNAMKGTNVVVSAPTTNTNNVSSSSTAFAFPQNENPQDVYGRTLTRRGYR